jgi:hypothetical protein
MPSACEFLPKICCSKPYSWPKASSGEGDQEDLDTFSKVAVSANTSFLARKMAGTARLGRDFF